MSLRGRRISAGAAIAVGILVAVAAGRKSPVVSADAPSYRRLGPVRAAVVMTEYSDFQCPKCAEVQVTLKSLRAIDPNRIALVFRHTPLRQHRWATAAGQAAEAAGLQGKFWEYSERLFARQKEWAPTPSPDPSHEPRTFFLQYARELGLDEARFSSDMGGTTVTERVKKDKAHSDAIGIPATPTVFINDRMLVGDTQVSAMGARFIDRALNP